MSAKASNAPRGALQRRTRLRYRWAALLAGLAAAAIGLVAMIEIPDANPEFLLAWGTYILEGKGIEQRAHRLWEFATDGHGILTFLTWQTVMLVVFVPLFLLLLLLAFVLPKSWLDFIDLFVFALIYGLLERLFLGSQSLVGYALFFGIYIALQTPGIWRCVPFSVTYRDTASGILLLSPQEARQRILPDDLPFDAAQEDGAAPLYFIDPMPEIAVTARPDGLWHVMETTLTGGRHFYEITYAFNPHPEGCLVHVSLTLHKTAPGCWLRLWSQNAARAAVIALQQAHARPEPGQAKALQASAAPSLS